MSTTTPEPDAPIGAQAGAPTGQPAAEPAISVKGLVKRFPGGITAVNGLDMEVPYGQVLGFLGPNGAGKSTSMKMITGFLTPTAGEIHVAGFNVAEQPLSVKAAIGYLPEGAPAYPDMTPLQFLKFCARVRGIRGSDQKDAVDRAIAKTQLEGVVHQPIDTLSKGFKRRVGLAQSILHDPSVLILDEPTDGLDPNQKHEVRELIRSMAEGGSKSIVLSTHILEEVDAVCDRAVIIAKGQLLADDTPAALQARDPEGRLDRVFRTITTGRAAEVA